MIPKHEENKKKCAERLQEMRKRNRKSQKCVAELLGANQSRLCTWEKGEFLPSASALTELADLYGCTVDYILGRTDVPG